VLALPPPVTLHTQEGPPLDTVQGMVTRLVMCGLAIREAEVAADCPDKPRQAQTRPDKTRQDQTNSNKTGKPRQAKTSPDKPRQA
jgi:hypothetical protein